MGEIEAWISFNQYEYAIRASVTKMFDYGDMIEDESYDVQYRGCGKDNVFFSSDFCKKVETNVLLKFTHP